MRRVAGRVDAGVEPGGAGGWSLAVVGRAEEITDPGDIDRLARERHVLWRPSEPRWMRIVASKVTGRRIGAVAR